MFKDEAKGAQIEEFVGLRSSFILSKYTEKRRKNARELRKMWLLKA